jgi:hypothetical protein
MQVHVQIYERLDVELSAISAWVILGCLTVGRKVSSG